MSLHFFFASFKPSESFDQRPFYNPSGKKEDTCKMSRIFPLAKIRLEVVPSHMHKHHPFLSAKRKQSLPALKAQGSRPCQRRVAQLTVTAAVRVGSVGEEARERRKHPQQLHLGASLLPLRRPDWPPATSDERRAASGERRPPSFSGCQSRWSKVDATSERRCGARAFRYHILSACGTACDGSSRTSLHIFSYESTFCGGVEAPPPLCVTLFFSFSPRGCRFFLFLALWNFIVFSCFELLPVVGCVANVAILVDQTNY